LEDCIEFVIHLDKKPDWYFRFIPSCMAPALPLDEAVTEVKKLRDRVEDVSLRNLRYNLIPDYSGSKQQLVPATSVATDTFGILIERDHTKMQLQGVADLSMLLMVEAGDHVAVVSVLGSPGDPYITHIINEAYGVPETGATFGCRGWAKVTHPFNSHEFQRSLLIQFHTNSCQQNEACVDVNTLKRLEAAAEGELVQDFMEIMKEKRYLVVLENISSMVEWETVRAYLPDGKKGSCIIIPTQKPEIARMCVGEPSQVLELKHYYSAERSVFVFFRKVSKMRHNRVTLRKLFFCFLLSISALSYKTIDLRSICFKRSAVRRKNFSHHLSS
jgi:urease gamma subunit